jgi:hypothetical protein
LLNFNKSLYVSAGVCPVSGVPILYYIPDVKSFMVVSAIS